MTQAYIQLNGFTKTKSVCWNGPATLWFSSDFESQKYWFDTSLLVLVHLSTFWFPGICEYAETHMNVIFFPTCHSWTQVQRANRWLYLNTHLWVTFGYLCSSNLFTLTVFSISSDHSECKRQGWQYCSRHRSSCKCSVVLPLIINAGLHVSCLKVVETWDWCHVIQHHVGLLVSMSSNIYNAAQLLL